MRENRTCGSEGGEGNLPDPYHVLCFVLRGGAADEAAGRVEGEAAPAGS